MNVFKGVMFFEGEAGVPTDRNDAFEPQFGARADARQRFRPVFGSRQEGREVLAANAAEYDDPTLQACA